jgi:hypothetical protein
MNVHAVVDCCFAGVVWLRCSSSHAALWYCTFCCTATWSLTEVLHQTCCARISVVFCMHEQTTILSASLDYKKHACEGGLNWPPFMDSVHGDTDNVRSASVDPHSDGCIAFHYQQVPVATRVRTPSVHRICFRTRRSKLRSKTHRTPTSVDQQYSIRRLYSRGAANTRLCDLEQPFRRTEWCKALEVRSSAWIVERLQVSNPDR